MLDTIISYSAYPLVEFVQKRTIITKVAHLRKFYTLSPEERLQTIKKKLHYVVSSAAQDVPYYKDLFQRIAFEPDKLKTDIKYLNDIPYLNKNILNEQAERCLSKKFNQQKLHVRKTGGSTGPSTIIYYDDDALDWTAAVNLLVLEWANKKRYMKEVHFSSRFPEKFPLKDRLKESIKCLILNRVNIETDSLDPTSAQKILQILNRIKPYSVQGHPSTLYSLAIFARQNLKKNHNLFKIFESTGEVLDLKKKLFIQDTFGCTVYNRYGSAEFGVIAHTDALNCEALKVLDFIAWPEVLLNQDGYKEIILTGLTNQAMPLIRYQTGDLGEIETFQGDLYIKNIIGRSHDFVNIGGKTYPTHYIQDLLDRIGGIDEFQIKQITSNTCLLKIVLNTSVSQEFIRKKVEIWWKDNIKVEFIELSDLVKQGWRSKFRHLIP
jgi:phenylacetate-CoA ligase